MGKAMKYSLGKSLNCVGRFSESYYTHLNGLFEYSSVRAERCGVDPNIYPQVEGPISWNSLRKAGGLDEIICSFNLKTFAFLDIFIYDNSV